MARLLLIYIFGCYLAIAVPNVTAQLVVAHRARSFDAPENTLAAFRLAWEQGADVIEGDFHLSRDKEIVCIHDDTTERVADVNLRVSDSTHGELAAIDVGSWKDPRFSEQRIPLLSDVLGTIPTGKRVFIEVKSGPEIVPVLNGLLTEADVAPGQAAIISFKEEVIEASKKAMPDRMAYWLVGFDRQKDGVWRPTLAQVVATAKAIDADGVDLQAVSEVVNSSAVAACRDAELSVHVWTVDEEEVADHFQQLGVDSITTNRPNLLRERLFPADAALSTSSGELIRQ